MIYRFLAIPVAAITVTLTGCSGSQPSIGAPGVMPQTSAIATHADRGASWMSPKARNGRLIYVTGDLGIYVYTYPAGEFVGKLNPGFSQAYGECVDASGDVFVVSVSSLSSTSSTIYEYAHGGTTPIASLSDPSRAFSCSVDPTTGNLAAAGKGVAVFKNASGHPTIFSSRLAFLYCGYDNSGNLYLSAKNTQTGDKALLVRLARDSSTFQEINVNETIYYLSDSWPSVQWDGRHMTISSQFDQRRNPRPINRLRISGDSAKVVSTTELASAKNEYEGQSWIQDGSVLSIYHSSHGWDVGRWLYPQGGDPHLIARRVANLQNPYSYGLVVSKASNR